MKKYILYIASVLAVLTSCSKDDKPETKVPNKLTKITCMKNGNPYFTADISYNAVDGSVNRITKSDGVTIRYEYIDNTILESRSNGSVTSNITHRTKYNLIIQTEIQAENPYLSNETYIRDSYSYQYLRSHLDSTIWTYKWPIVESPKEYESRTNKIDTYNWENGLITYYDQNPTARMEYQYSTIQHPENFTYRTMNSLYPVEFENLTPFNVYFGEYNQFLVQKAYWYDITAANEICAEYNFSYNGISDYITGMTITEQINASSGKAAQNNTYVYTFEYNYDPN